MKRDAQLTDLIRKNDHDIVLFRKHMAALKSARGPHQRQYIADLERRIALAEKSNAILRAAQ